MNAKRQAFVEGYQEALSDIKKEWDQLGPEAALKWINANLRSTAAESELDRLNAEIATRTGGKKLGKMSSEELIAAFGNNSIHFRDGKVVLP